MDTNKAIESRRHNENLFNPLLEIKTSDDAYYNHSIQIFQVLLRTFCVEISGHGSECSSSELSNFSLMQPITFFSLNGALKFSDVTMLFSQMMRWPITYRHVCQLW